MMTTESPQQDPTVDSAPPTPGKSETIQSVPLLAVCFCCSSLLTCKMPPVTALRKSPSASALSPDFPATAEVEWDIPGDFTDALGRGVQPSGAGCWPRARSCH